MIDVLLTSENLSKGISTCKFPQLSIENPLFLLSVRKTRFIVESRTDAKIEIDFINLQSIEKVEKRPKKRKKAKKGVYPRFPKSAKKGQKRVKNRRFFVKIAFFRLPEKWYKKGGFFGVFFDFFSRQTYTQGENPKKREKSCFPWIPY
jgi:hypothetical protein